MASSQSDEEGSSDEYSEGDEKTTPADAIRGALDQLNEEVAQNTYDENIPAPIPFNKDARNPETKRKFFQTVVDNKYSEYKLYPLIKRQYEVENNQNEPLPDDAVLQEFIDTMTPEHFYGTAVPPSEDKDIEFRSLLLCYLAMLYYEDSEIEIHAPRWPANQLESFDEEAYRRFDNAPLLAQRDRQTHVRKWRDFFENWYSYSRMFRLENAYKQTPPMKLEQWEESRKNELKRQQAEKDEKARVMARAVQEQKDLKQAEFQAELDKKRERDVQWMQERQSRPRKLATEPLSPKAFKRHLDAHKLTSGAYVRLAPCDICTRQRASVDHHSLPAPTSRQEQKDLKQAEYQTELEKKREKEPLSPKTFQCASADHHHHHLPAPTIRQEQTATRRALCDKCGDVLDDCLCDME